MSGTETESVTEAEIAAFAAGTLAPGRRRAVAARLAADPARAAAAMAEMELTEALRQALGTLQRPAPAATRAAALRLGRALARDRAGRRLLARARPVAAALALVALGWSGAALTRLGVQGWSDPGGLAPLIEAALDAQAALALRLAMDSQPETQVLDAAEIAATLGIALPALPPDWRIRDVQVVATPERPGVAILVEAPDLGEVMLFSVAQAGKPDLAPDAFAYDGRALAVFRKDRAAYVLVDTSGPAADLSRGAQALLRRFN